MDPAEAKEARTEKIVYHLETIFTTINHMLIAYVTIYLSYYSYTRGFGNLFTWHVFLCSVGYQFFMAESFLTLLSSNSWTDRYSIVTKRRLHWILQVVGCAAIFAGTIIEIKIKEDAGRSHFKSDHAITGLVSMIFIVLSFLNGVAALYTTKIKHIIKPVYVKMCHYLTGIVAFVIGMTSLALEYSPRMISQKHMDMLIAFTSITTAFTLLGVCKTMFNQFRAMCK
ncbi:probable transmembrane reductase CYB561D1 [Anopheles cruzii]|uniref:probable transmembrane reductase CYB561D1 n=1 Tax=Anopheles cruzii TaxID=68878 RepID=UPI0022EC70C0|nr:probable transmembrane reductase CYB561D1 [Anopheles cruzii]